MAKIFNYFYYHISTGEFDLLGFIGAIIGVIGAYFIASYEFRKQNKIEKNYALDMLCCLLNTTILETEYVIEIFIQKCRYYWENKIYEQYVENIKDDNLKEDVKASISEIDEKFYTNEESLYLFYHTLNLSVLGNLMNKFNNDVNKSFDFTGLIYDENWYSHLKFIDDKEKSYREYIIKWIRLIDNTIIEIPIDEDVEGSYLDIIKFIELREQIIEFLKLHGYDYHESYKEIYSLHIIAMG